MSIQKHSRVEVVDGPNKGCTGVVEFLYNKNGKLLASVYTTQNFPVWAEVLHLKETK